MSHTSEATRMPAVKTYQKGFHLVATAYDRDIGKHVFVPAIRPTYAPLGDGRVGIVSRGCWDASQWATFAAELRGERKRKAEDAARIVWGVWDAFMGVMQGVTAVSNDAALAAFATVGEMLVERHDIGGYEIGRVLVAKNVANWRTVGLPAAIDAIAAGDACEAAELAKWEAAEWEAAREREYTQDLRDAGLPTRDEYNYDARPDVARAIRSTEDAHARNVAPAPARRATRSDWDKARGLPA